MKKLFWAWLLALAGVIFLTWLYQGEATSFHGIAEANETSVSLQYPVEVVKVHVIPGQTVHEGDTLVELSRSELTQRLNEIRFELDALEGRTGLSTAGIDQKVAEVEAELQTRRNTLTFEIERIKSEYSRNQEIAARLKSLPAGSVPTAQSNDALTLRVQNLERELAMAERNAQGQIRLLRGSRGLQNQSNKAEVTVKQKELERLQQEQKALTIIANGEWVVASVDRRDGEKLSSFDPILSLTRKAPTMVKGFIQEKVYNAVAVGDSVEVHSSANPQNHVKGVVVGLGSRIVELPLRLRKVPEIIVYGREVSIQIPDTNHFMLGELTTIAQVPGWKTLIPQAQADSHPGKQANAESAPTVSDMEKAQ